MRPLLLALLLFVALPVAAQDEATRVGVGVRVNDLVSDLFSTSAFGSNLLVPATTLLVPIDVRGTIRVEPEIGFSRTSFGSDDDEFNNAASQFHLGLGLMKLLPRNAYSLYIGGRLQYTRLAETEESPFDDREFTRKILGVSPVVGGEYRFASRLSLGGEAGLLYRSYGFDSDGDSIDSDLSSISTTGAVYLRFYFN